MTRYVVLGKLAKGGMAEVWLARQRGPAGFNKTLVLKTIASPMSEQPSFVTMFLEEATLAAQLNHPNVVQIFDLDQHEGQHFIAMEYLDGRNLGHVSKALKERNQVMAPPMAARVVAEACAGIEYAHTLHDAMGKPLNIIHRDVTPENIFITYQGQVKLLDFGIAKAAASSNLTQPGTVRGKLAFLAPEQVLGHKIDKRVDLWALGVNLYVLLTGQFPFGSAGNELDFMRNILQAEVQPPSTLRPNIPKTLDAIVLKALGKEADQRFQSAAEFRAQLEEVLKGFPAVGAYHLAQAMEQLFPASTDVARQKLRALLEADAAGSSPSLAAAPELATTRPVPTPAGLRGLGNNPPTPDLTLPDRPKVIVDANGEPAGPDQTREIPRGMLDQHLDASAQLSTSQFQALMDGSLKVGSSSEKTVQTGGPSTDQLDLPSHAEKTVISAPPVAPPEADPLGVPQGSRTGLTAESTLIMRSRTTGVTTHLNESTAIDDEITLRIRRKLTPRMLGMVGGGVGVFVALLVILLSRGSPKPAATDPARHPPVVATNNGEKTDKANPPAGTDKPPEGPAAKPQGIAESTPPSRAADPPPVDEKREAPPEPKGDEKVEPEKAEPEDKHDEVAPDDLLLPEPPRPTPAPRREGPPRARPGALTVSSPVKADVFVDGKKVGRTPVTLKNVGPGDHRLRAVATDGSGTVELTVPVVSGVLTERVLAWKMGQLAVKASPWATVRVDGRFVGQTPIAPMKLSVGTHDVTLENKQLKVKKTVKVTISEGALEEVKMKLEQ